MSVHAKHAGRETTCPICGTRIQIPTLDDPSIQEEPIPQETDAQDAPSDDAAQENVPDFDVDDSPFVEDSSDGDPNVSTATDAREIVERQRRQDDARAAFAQDFVFELPKPDPNDPIVQRIPDFLPNPFAVSYPLDAVVANDPEEEEEEKVVSSKMPSLDELIN